MKTKLIAGCLVVSLAGCATQQRFTERMNSFIGQHESALISQIGPPDSSYTYATGQKTLTFRRASTMQVGGGTTLQPVMTQHTGNVSAYGTGGSSYGTYSGTSTTYQQVQQPTYNVNLSCQLNVNVDANGYIRSWAANGNHCVSQ